MLMSRVAAKIKMKRSRPDEMRGESSGDNYPSQKLRKMVGYLVTMVECLGGNLTEFRKPIRVSMYQC